MVAMQATLQSYPWEKEVKHPRRMLLVASVVLEVVVTRGCRQYRSLFFQDFRG